MPWEEIAGYIALVLTWRIRLVITDSGCFGLAQVSCKKFYLALEAIHKVYYSLYPTSADVQFKI
jgi:hypothetical protein